MPDSSGFTSRAALCGYGLAVVVLILDQLTKHWASATLVYRDPIAVTSWFDFMLAHNTGAAFSFLADAGGWQRWFFTVVTLVVSVILVVWLSRLSRSQLWLGFGLGLILGGGLGNLWDRMALGYVVDFVSLHYRNWYWPAFNVADSAISVGAVLLIADSFFPKKVSASENKGVADG
jgi:signal peptidase II